MTTKTTTEPKTLQELFSRDDSWCQGASARTKEGWLCGLEIAHSFCIYGGYQKIYSNTPMCQDIWYKIYNYTTEKTGKTPISWNDSSKRTIDDVRKLVRELNI